jgi:RNA polymerase sigma-70 factor, ECF subfamily
MAESGASDPGQRLLAASGLAIGEDAGVRADLASTLVHLVERAQQAWPAWRLAPEPFAAYLGARCPAGQPVARALSGLFVDDLYLAFACSQRVAAAIEVIHTDHLADAATAVSHQYRNSVLADEVRQRLSERLLLAAADSAPGIEQYSGRGSLRGWLRVIALRDAARQVGQRELPNDNDVLFDRVIGGEDHALLRAKASYRKLFKDAFNAAVGALSIHDRLLLRQHFCDGLSLDEMARLQRVHRATAARHLAKVRDKLLERTRAYFERELSIDRADFDELMALISSHLDASISRLFG